MTYEFRCGDCNLLFDIIKSIKEFTRTEKCTNCGGQAEIQVSRNVSFIGTSVESPEYNPALGCVVKNKKHREEIAKRKGLIEIGNEPVESIHKAADKTRREKRKKAWEGV